MPTTINFDSQISGVLQVEGVSAWLLLCTVGLFLRGYIIIGVCGDFYLPRNNIHNEQVMNNLLYSTTCIWSLYMPTWPL